MVSEYEGIRGGLVGVMRGIGHRGGNDRGHAQSNGSAELRASVEHGATQSLHVRWEDVRDDEQADGE